MAGLASVDVVEMLAVRPVMAVDWDRLEMPEGYRAEVIRGEMVVAPGPTMDHGRSAVRLARLLDPFMPPEFEGVVGPEWRLEIEGVVAMAPQPDVMVVRSDAKLLDQPPLLAIAILSLSDRQRLATGPTRIEGKRLDYGANGLTDYVEVDLSGQQPVVVRYEVIDGALVEADRVSGEDRMISGRPFAYELVPADLTRPRPPGRAGAH